MRPLGWPLRSARVDTAEELLRRLALNDEETVTRVLTSAAAPGAEKPLSPKLEHLVELSALLAVGAATTSLRSAVELARSAGATKDEIVGVLVAVGPAIGLARLVTTAARLATAIGYDVDEPV